MLDNTKKLIKEMGLEIGPVFTKESELEVIEVLPNAVDVRESQFGYFLNIDVDGHKHAINLKGVLKGQLDAAVKKFKLEVWTAVRSFKPTNSPNTIKLGDKRVFAVIA